MTGQTRHRLLRAALAVALCAGVGGAALAAGYRSSGAVLGDDSAYLQKGHTVAHVNAASGRSDAQAAKDMATGAQQLEVVQVSPGVVYVVNNDTGQVYRLPTGSLSPQPVESRPDAKGKLHVVTGHHQTYLVDSGHGTVSYLPGSSDGRRTEVPVPHHVDQVVVDSAGTAWGLASAAGELYRIVKGAVTRTIAVGRGGTPQLTLTADHPVVYRPGSGTVAEYGPDGLVRKLTIPPEPVSVLAAPGADANVAVIAEPRTGEVVTVDFDRDAADMVALPGRAGTRFGPPVVLNGRIYLPDYTAHQVVVITLRPLRPVGYTPVPGRSATFDVFVRDGRVWANDGYASSVVTFDRNGHHSVLDKGTGEPASDGDADPQPADPAAREPVDPGHHATGGTDDTPGTPPAPSLRTPGPSLRTPGPTRRVRMPQVVGLDKGRACQLVRSAGFTGGCALVAKPDRRGTTGEVLSTSPTAGATVPAGSTVTVFYRGPYEVPDLAGMTVDTACDTLAAVRLTCRRQATGAAGTAAGVNLVSGQQPAAHAPVATGTRVTVQYPTRVTVPDVLSQPPLDQATACQRITDVGLACAPQSRGACQPAGKVVDQDPPATGAADPGGPVTVGVCLADTTVPVVTGLAPDAACAAIQQAHLTCAPNPSEASRTPNQVHQQSPAAGTVVTEGGQVGYLYAGDTPVRLDRWKMPDNGDPHHANFLAAEGGVPPPGGWAPESSLGWVYPVGAANIANVVPIYASVCAGGCAETGSFYFSQRNTSAGTGWQLQGEVFRGFSVQVPGSQPLDEFFLRWSYKDGKGQTRTVHTWLLAIPGSAEYTTFRSAGQIATNPDGSPMEFVLCYIWPPA